MVKEKNPKMPERLTSGVKRLDYILKGGFIRGGTYIIMGPPGSGKTIFGNQTCFNHIRSHKGRCIYLTLLSESHGKMFQHLSSMKFFDPNLIQGNLSYISGYRTLRQEKLKGLLGLIRKHIKEFRATLLVIDGLQSAIKNSGDEMDFEEFLHELQAYVNMLDCTTLLLSPQLRSSRHEVETVGSDGIIEMSYKLVGPRAVRELTVHKFRGTDFLLGKHEMEITDNGLQIHPRTEVQFDTPSDMAMEEREGMAFGIAELDEMLQGGLMSGTTTVLLGAPGTGKTMLGLSFLVEGARKGQKGIYFGFYEPTPRLIEKAKRVGLPLKKFIQKGLIEIIWQPPLERNMDSLAETLLEKIKHEDKEKGRLFIDGAEGFRKAAVYTERIPKFLSAFTNQLRMSDVTSIISEELDLYKGEFDLPTPELATVTEGVILLRYLELKFQIHRIISILKMRESFYDTSIREFQITEKGIKVSDSFERIDSLLTGSGHLLRGNGADEARRE